MRSSYVQGGDKQDNVCRAVINNNNGKRNGIGEFESTETDERWQPIELMVELIFF